MANVIKYKTSQPTKRGLRKGNAVIGTGEENYGPTSTTGYVSGITPPDGGYVVYTLGIGDNPAIYVANSDSDLISIAKTIAAQNFHPSPTDIFGWVTAGNNSNYSRDSIESPVGNTPLLMSVTGNDPYTNSYNSSTWNMASAKAGETWQVSCWVKASQPCDGHFFIFGTNDAGSYSAVNDFGSNTFDIETEWQRFSFSRTFTNAAVTQIQVRLDGPDNGGSGIDVHWDGLQVERSSDVSYFRDNSSSISNISEAKAYLASIEDVWVLETIPNNITTDGLIAHIQSNRLSSYPETGTTVYDLSGNGNDGTLQNGTVFNNGVWELDGVDDRVDIADPGYPSSGTDPFSIDITFMVPTGATWYINGSGTAIIGRGSYAGSLGIFRSSTEGRVSFWARLNGGNIYDPAVTGITRDEWHHIVGTFDGNDTAKIYHNGEYIAQEVNTNNAGTFDADQYSIGGNTAFGGNNGQYGGVHIAEAKIYNKALSADEVSRNFYKGNTVTNNLKLHLDAGNLLSTQDESAWFDLSGNGYTATKYGSPVLTTLGGAKCWNFDSIGDYFDINNTFGGLSACTLEAWIYPAASELSSGDRGTIIQGHIYMSWNKSNRRLSSYWYSTDNRGYHEPTLQMNREEWYHLCTVWTGTKLLQYIDGNLENTVTTTVSNGSMSGRIGRESDGRQFAGGISMIKVYTDALTAEEVANHYNSYKTRYGK